MSPLSSERTQTDYPAYRRYVKGQQEAKMRAQTQYLVAKFHKLARVAAEPARNVLATKG